MTPEIIALARTAVMTKVAYWDALRAFETATTSDPYGNGDWADRTNDKVLEAIDSLAAFASMDEPIADDDLVDLIALAQEAA